MQYSVVFSYGHENTLLEKNGNRLLEHPTRYKYYTNAPQYYKHTSYFVSLIEKILVLIAKKLFKCNKKNICQGS